MMADFRCLHCQLMDLRIMERYVPGVSSKPLVPPRSAPGPAASRNAARREWGQNFFRSAAAARRFSEQLEDSYFPTGFPAGALTVEIGAGSGRVTKALAAAGRPLLAVEIDIHWARRLAAESLPDVTVVNEDFLTLRLPRQPVRLIGNLPFVSGTGILRRCLDLGPDLMRGGVFLLQREYVGKRTGVWGGNLFNAQWEPWYAFGEGLAFSRHEFSPVPRADTSTLLVAPRRRPSVPWSERAAYQRFAQEFFDTGRMTVGDAAHKVLRRGHARFARGAGVRPDDRLKDLTAQDWAALYRAYRDGREDRAGDPGRPARPARPARSGRRPDGRRHPRAGG
ncbi:23S ribosomal RNA methyltransferase Erm [Streptomyces albireticuli]|uniref:23S rRNA (Adenine(2058)-N(6))-methyltransferase Erm(N) n=2 Tax=Streptomyces albireticuli TaxID=1940 RepID=A0A2A2D7Y9_9ACTN|nr:23S ribosomal RNA methyltransferase Erm [Streptomyces albireticuli]PAU47489.1 23S rRNA (adenine(2058)-N(6))-methyltransferase Erm(N) [Streptomyces albireticuli]